MHHPDRRVFLRDALALASASVTPGLVLADAAYPSRPIRVLIGTPPGDTADGWIRGLTDGMARSLGQPLVVDNKPGAHGIIVGSLAKSAAPDGYTLLVSTGGPMAINPSVYKGKLPYDPLKDFVPIAPVLKGALFLYCNNDVPVRNVKEMVAWVKAQPAPVSYGSGGTGTTQHLAMEMLKRATGMQMTHVPYRGSPMVLQDVIGGQIPFAFDAGGSLLPQARSGRVRVFAVTSTARDPAMPEVPTVIEQGIPGFEARVWMGLFAPAGTPADIVAKVHDAVNKAAATPEYSARLASAASVPWLGTGEDLRSFLADDIQRWAVIVQQAGVKAD
ncbi:tripartite tricarboxylate transporter substrate binding protein [Ramlibacter ginsenosidimutans]|uniref:Tripartite tricarboxylate transporter substrate binding protein n=1 Tax=Ramlibacter ginsenosidimutans TaxID=502333 RepID=A0A934WPJ1_9BURK|nr:tripartite tricarboxylate transporter substrate binding protein [Ramlibacter ginsenosidimutans]MBK6008237.1 tripartite tricarboxylate transporter substrate binding protein [Ramlibacter ginsenosidimutans]